MKVLRLKIKGMGCEGAAIRIDRVKQKVPGILSVTTSYETEESIMRIKDGVDISKIIDFIEELDYYVKDYDIQNIEK